MPEDTGGQEAADQSLDLSTLEPLGTSSGSRAALPPQHPEGVGREAGKSTQKGGQTMHGLGGQALDAFQTAGTSPPRYDRRSYVLVDGPKFDQPTPAHRALLVEVLADLLVASLAHSSLDGTIVPPGTDTPPSGHVGNGGAR